MAEGAAGARVLFAWELGGGYGHLAGLLPFADRLAQEGVPVTLAMQPGLNARALIGDRRHALIEAPALPGAPAVRRIESWADLAGNAGYADAAAATRVLGQWRDIIRAHRARLVVADLAPGAMLAARIADVPCLSVGAGWNSPPPTTPLPAIRFWQPPPPAALAASEARLLAGVAPAMRALGGAAPANLAALFTLADVALCCLPELDHYQARGAADYFGTVFATAEGVLPHWPAAAGPRCFAYLNGQHPALRALLAGLGAVGWPTVLHLRGVPAIDATGLPPNIWLAPGPLRLDAILPERPLVLCQGANLVSQALVAGCPVLLAPEHLEQTALANRVLTQGLGLAFDPAGDAAAATALLRRLHEEPRHRAAAEAFATRYHGYTPALAVEAVVAECLARLG